MKEYSIRCNQRQLQIGDQIMFDKALFSGTYPNIRLNGWQQMFGTITGTYVDKSGYDCYIIDILDKIIKMRESTLFKSEVKRMPRDNENMN